MKKIKEFVLTKDFIIKSLCGITASLFLILLTLVLFIVNKIFK